MIFFKFYLTLRRYILYGMGKVALTYLINHHAVETDVLLEVQLYTFLTVARNAGSSQVYVPAVLSTGYKSKYHCIRGCVGLKRRPGVYEGKFILPEIKIVFCITEN
jgi:hypothetical protein